MSFPRLRFEQAGASAEEVSELEQAFDQLPPGVQESQLEQLAGISNYDIAALIQARREEPAESEEEPDPDSDPDPDPPQPPGPSGSPGARVDQGAGTEPAGK